MSTSESFAAHLAKVEAYAGEALEHSSAAGEHYDAIVFHAGSLESYYADDLAIPFRTHAHFMRFAPIPGPNHLLIYSPREPTRVLRSVATDYWSAPAKDLDAYVSQALSVEPCDDVIAAASASLPAGRCAFVGGDAALAASLGIARESVDPQTLIAALDWSRATKTDYEIDCLREAQRRAGVGHSVLRDGIAIGRSEFELHLLYLAATQHEEAGLPYPSIIAWDEASAVLHYQQRRRSAPSPRLSFLADAGAQASGYASDITRTYCLADGDSAANEFRALLDGMEALQQRLAAAVAPGVSFVDLHREAEREIAELLIEADIIKVSWEDARARGLVRAFFPHGLGHFLGLQVHDVGGQQADVSGGIVPPPDDCPNLRTTRTLEPGHVVTIEPGLYFIESLLEPLREGEHRDALDWSRIDALSPFGGIRIEDDVLVTEDGGNNLTRPFVPGHLDLV